MRIILLSSILVLGFVATLQAQSSLFLQQAKPTHPNDKSSVEATALFSSQPLSGFLPVRIKVVNDRKKPVTIRLDAVSSVTEYHNNNSQMSSEFSITVKSGTASTHDLLVPVVTAIESSAGYYSNDISLSLTGDLGRNYGSLTSIFSFNNPSILISESLHTPNAGALNSAIMSRFASSHRYGSEAFAARFNPEMLPEDWRAFSGYDIVMATENDWLAMTPAARNAILEGCRHGKSLVIYRLGQSQASYPALDIEALPDPKNPDRASYGFGEIRLMRIATPSALDAKATVKEFYNSAKPVISRSINSDYSSNWPLHAAFGDRKFSYALFIVVLVLFGIVVGPVNLFVFAKSGQRHKLFITTPIISIATSLLLVGLILIQDGIGGKGMTVSLMEVRPDHGENRAYLIQEQVSRTGVLIGGSFELDESATITPVPIANSEWARLTAMSGGAGMRYTAEVDGDKYATSGDWFKSRSEQGQLIHAVIPTRSRIEIKSTAGPPVLNSTFNHSIDRLYYADESDGYWLAESIETGTATTCSSISKSEYFAAIDELADELAKRQANALRRAARRRGHFVAIADAAPPLKSFDSIDWEPHATIITGPPAR